MTGAAVSAELDIKFVNTTQGMALTPILVAAHDANTALFRVGETASAALETMAEGGDISPLKTELEAVGAVSLDLTSAPTLAGTTHMGSLDTGTNMYLSLTAMLLPTNDGFVGLDSWKIPSQAGTYTLMLNAYDAGTEVNNELIVPGAADELGIPGNPTGMGGVNGSGASSSEGNANIHIHPGNLGDTNAEGGFSDVDSRVHRWLNPVAKLVITVK
ncbi:spondin domain-containing protein [Catenovulum adriaticum]|uniref:Spondin domain-containing protein n=2 Tax=Catenovulum adriaticum TaxID=2984846 RepID=A0ABY7AQ67_9ALTE|nr:spondin domain-containing protein [Catenovulum sp. TS8]WAJ71634.1 spondin domain-containing protein [Catenovulum sp. TS8]